MINGKYLNSRWLPGLIVGGCLALAGIATYLSLPSQKEENSLKAVIIKADTNRDGILQNNELASMLKSVNCAQPIPENAKPSVQIASGREYAKTYVDYGGWVSEGFSAAHKEVTIYLSPKDIESYLSQK